MGAGRKTSTYDIDTGAQQLGFVERQRNLGENLGGVIFGCSHDTYDECVNGLIFGLPRPHICYVQYIVPGMPVFLYNYSDRTMHGIFKAVSEGDLEINPRGWTTFPNQRTQYPAQVRVEVYNQCPSLSEREFRPLLKDCYSQDTSQSSRLCFELKRSEAQNLCRLFNAASARVNLGAGATRPASQAAASNSKAAGTASSSSLGEASTSEEIFPALGSDWQQVPGKKRRDAFDPNAQSAGGAWVRAAGAPPGKAPTPSPAASEAPLPAAAATASRALEPASSHDQQNRPQRANGGQAELRADPAALANGAYDAPTKKGRQADAAHLSPQIAPSSWQSGSAQAAPRQTDSNTDRQSHTSNSLTAAQAQLAHLPQIQAEQQRLREGAAAMADELVSLRQHMAFLTTSNGSPNGMPHGRSSPNGVLPQHGDSPLPSAAISGPLGMTQGLQGQELYLTGGNDGTAWLDAVEVYTPTRGSWVTAQPMPLERGYGAAAAIGRQMFVMGGGNGSSWLQSVMMCNLETGTWVEVAPMEFVRGSLAAVALNNKLYAMGGGQPNVNRDSTEVYDAHHNAWSTGPTMNHRRFTTAAALHNNSIFVSGGYDGTQYLRSVERLDPREGKWQMVAEMQQKRGSHASTVAFDQVFALGGWDANAFLDSVEIYDVRTDSWRYVANMEASRAYGAAVTVDGQVYALGGMRDAHHNEVVERYDSASNTWHKITPPSHILHKRAFLAACVVDMS
ncbi:hypothetical protein WJX79_003839 [Trebouxia sp. C0005]